MADTINVRISICTFLIYNNNRNLAGDCLIKLFLFSTCSIQSGGVTLFTIDYATALLHFLIPGNHSCAQNSVLFMCTLVLFPL